MKLFNADVCIYSRGFTFQYDHYEHHYSSDIWFNGQYIGTISDSLNYVVSCFDLLLEKGLVESSADYTSFYRAMEQNEFFIYYKHFYVDSPDFLPRLVEEKQLVFNYDDPTA